MAGSGHPGRLRNGRRNRAGIETPVPCLRLLETVAFFVVEAELSGVFFQPSVDLAILAPAFPKIEGYTTLVIGLAGFRGDGAIVLNIAFVELFLLFIRPKR